MNFQDDRHGQLYQYWLEKKQNKIAPTRDNIDPIDFPNLLPYIFLVDVKWNPTIYSMRLVGDHIAKEIGRDCKGLTLDQIFKDKQHVEITLADYNRAAIYCQPVFSMFKSGLINKDFNAYNRLLLPLSQDGKCVNMLLGITIFSNETKLGALI